MVLLTQTTIDYLASTERVRSSNAGAVMLFLGTVREITQGRRTVALDYEAYPEMALAMMQSLEDEARARWPIVGLEIIHRLGRLQLGDISISIALSTPHRAEAFEAGQFLIDEFKQRVPIWKKENWADGSTAWVHPEKGSISQSSSCNFLQESQ